MATFAKKISTSSISAVIGGLCLVAGLIVVTTPKPNIALVLTLAIIGAIAFSLAHALNK
jgi:uncharacterized membrane protein HdeD (DUF308 family)